MLTQRKSVCKEVQCELLEKFVVYVDFVTNQQIMSKLKVDYIKILYEILLILLIVFQSVGQ